MVTYGIEVTEFDSEVRCDLRGHWRPLWPIPCSVIKKVARIEDGTLRNEIKLAAVARRERGLSGTVDSPSIASNAVCQADREIERPRPRS